MAEAPFVGAAPPEPIVPNWGDAAVPMPHLQSSVDIGSFLVIEPSNGYEMNLIVQLVASQHAPETGYTLTVKRFRVARAVGTGPNLLSRHMDRVFPTEESWDIQVDEVMDIVFLFRQHDIDNLEVVPQGRKDSFFLPGGQADDVNFRKFPCEAENFNLPISHSRRIWRDSDIIRRSFRRVLCSERMEQAAFFKTQVRVSISEEGWCYFQRKVLERGALDDLLYDPEANQVGRTDYEFNPALRGCAKRRRFDAESLTFTGEVGIQCLSEMLGEASTIGVRQRRPKVDTGFRRLVVGDHLAYLDSCSMRFSDGSVLLKFNVRRYRYTTDVGGHPINCPSETLRRFLVRGPSNQTRYFLVLEEEDDDDDDPELAADNDDDDDAFDEVEAQELVRPPHRFMFGALLYQVVRCHGNRANSMVDCVRVNQLDNPDRNEIGLVKAVVARLVRIHLL